MQLKVVYRREKFQSTLPARGATIGVGNHTARTLHFNPRSPHGERPAGQRKGLLSFHFNPRSPHGERPMPEKQKEQLISHFNPRSPHGERQRNPHYASSAPIFQSTLPARGATNAHPQRNRGERFQSTLPARGATRSCRADRRGWKGFQSTLPARGATLAKIAGVYPELISIHAPRTGSDSATPNAIINMVTFQSTLPARGATCNGGAVINSYQHFNPRSPHGERHLCGFARLCAKVISIHAPRTGSDPAGQPVAGNRKIFQSTLPARGATGEHPSTRLQGTDFNPRSPHGERPGSLRECRRSMVHFNPRSPHGERRHFSALHQ